MLSQLLLLVLGTALILWGADKLTDGASGLARRLGMSELMVGLTVVAFGTSMPEFIVSLLSSVRGSADMAVGNIFGSNLFNTLVIVGGSALMAPMAMQRNVVSRDFVANILFAAGITAFCFLVGGGSLARWEGAAVLLLFLAYMVYTLRTHAHDRDDDAPSSPMPLTKALAWLIVGATCLVGGGQLLVDAATQIARAWGLSETIIGLTILAGGTSLPELATSLMAAHKGQPSLAIGNAVGSNLFNIGFVLGTCACITPMHITGITWGDGLALVLSAGLLLWVGRTEYRITRREGLVMLLAYALYLGLKIAGTF